MAPLGFNTFQIHISASGTTVCAYCCESLCPDRLSARKKVETSLLYGSVATEITLAVEKAAAINPQLCRSDQISNFIPSSFGIPILTSHSFADIIHFLRMSSDPNSSAVVWQVDITKLAAIVGRMGAEGLKKLQLSGVDIHTVGCLVALGEITPACVEFRSALQQCRNEQRRETWWLHAIVEFGTATNFLVDELLKTRAGENVLSLLAAVAPILEDDCGKALAMVYTKMKAPYHSTPSMGQLERVRSVCLPLARKMEFKDRLAETHQWLISQFSPSEFDMMTALPNPDTIANIITSLREIISQEGEAKNRLFYYGFQGAAWLLVYSCMVLGLQTCVVGNDGVVHPWQSTATYGSASVILFPQQREPSSVMHSIAGASEIVTLRPNDISLRCEKYSGFSTMGSANWVLSCGATPGSDTLRLICGWDIADRREIGNLIYSLAIDLIKLRLTLRGHQFSKSWLQSSFYGRQLPRFLTVLQRILVLFGLPDGLQEVEWCDQCIVTDDRNGWRLNLRMFSRMLRHNGEQYRFCCHDKLQPVELETLPSFCIRCRLLHASMELSYSASTLAFTDWADNLKQISSRRILFNETVLQGLSLQHVFRAVSDYATLNSGTVGEIALEDLKTDRVSLAQQTLAVCSGSSYSADIIRSNKHKFLGVNVDGVLLIDYRAIETSILEGPVFLLREGVFTLAGDERLVMTGTRNHGSQYSSEVLEISALQPMNRFEDYLKLSVQGALLKDSIQVSYLLEFDPPIESDDERSLEADVTVLNILPSLAALRVTYPCDHPASTPIGVSKVSLESDVDGQVVFWKDAEGSFWRIEEKLCGIRMRVPTEVAASVCDYIPVARNHLAQWAAISSLRRTEETQYCCFVQDVACLACTRLRAELDDFQGNLFFISK